MLKKKRTRDESGAVVVEATIALTAYIFAIYIILSIVNICYIQAKVSIALDNAAEDLSQYSYLYYRFGIDNLQSQLHEGTEDSRDMVSDTISGIGSLMDSMGQAGDSVDPDSMTVNFDNLNTALNNAGQSLGGLSDNVKQYADALAEDPKGFIIGMGKLAADELSGEANSFLGQAMGKAFVKKNLKAFPGEEPDAFLKRYHVKNGLDGLNFSGTQLMTYGISNKIQLVCTYEVEVVRLLDFEYTIRFRQCAQTSAWGNGVSKITPDISTTSKPGPTIWDMQNDMDRGKLIVKYEKDNYTYTDTGHGFDVYNNSNGGNEFITVMSLDTHASSYDTAGKIASKIRSNANQMRNKVSNLGDEIQVKGPGGDTTLTSDPATRTYRIVLVVPDDADPAMVSEAVRKFKETHSDFEVEVKTGYGSPTPKDSGNDAS